MEMKQAPERYPFGRLFYLEFSTIFLLKFVIYAVFAEIKGEKQKSMLTKQTEKIIFEVNRRYTFLTGHSPGTRV